MSDTILTAYSEHACAYDLEANQASLWGRLGEAALESLVIGPGRRCIADIGCGTGRALDYLASRLPASARLIGVEPAPGMRALARGRTAALANVTIKEGRFEAIPVADRAIDYLFSIHAFHWVSDVAQAMAELRRVLAADAELHIFFAGRGTGPEFIGVTSPILRRHLGFAQWIMSAKLRVQLGPEDAGEIFRNALPDREIRVCEHVETHFDTLEGHWAWWLRLEGHFSQLEPASRERCFAEIREALASLETDAGIPYTTRIVHVSAVPRAAAEGG